MGLIFRFTGGFGMDGANPQMMGLAMITYIGFICLSATNFIATIGFSREGKHFYILKTLPVSTKTLVLGKLIFATAVTAISTLLLGIITPITLGITNPVAIIGLPVSLLIGGFGMNTIGLKNDLKNPNLNWLNINELTKNNKRQLKPVLISVGIGIAYMIFGNILAFISMNETLLFTIYFGTLGATGAPLAYFGYKKLMENPELVEN
jgi:ABC-2 type transport system permease protein